MNNKLLPLLTLIFCTLFMSTMGFATTPPSTSLAPILKKATPAIVNIKSVIKVTDLNMLRLLQKQNPSGRGNAEGGQVPDTFVSVGSGVIVDAKNGYILTNAHVINDAKTVTVTLADGHHYNAKVIGLDKSSDVGLLQIKAKNLTAIPIGNSKIIEPGDYVIAIGNPFGLSQTATSGIVSAIGRTTLGIERYENFIQTDAPINPGNSGGALINMKGELIGINTAILAPNSGSIGIGFAIPSDMAQSVMVQLIKYGSVKRGALGITAQDISPELATALNLTIDKGAVISEVYPNSSAQQAGLKAGDVLIGIDGSPIKSANDVVTTVGFLRVDSTVKLSILRNNKSMTITATLIDPKKMEEMIEKIDPFLYGVGLKDFNQLNPLHGSVRGVVVTAVLEDTNAWHADIHPGDVIVSANQQPVTSVADLKSISAKAGDKLVLNVLRGPGAVFLVISKES